MVACEDWQGHLTEATRWCAGERLPLAENLRRWQVLATAAHAQPQAWRRAVAPRQWEVGWWLYRLALAVAAAGASEQAHELLDSLPGVAVSDEVREALRLALAAEPAWALAG
jgi:hypothetical protein